MGGDRSCRENPARGGAARSTPAPTAGSWRPRTAQLWALCRRPSPRGGNSSGDVAGQLGEVRCAALGGAAWESLRELLTGGASPWIASTSQVLDLMHEVLVGMSRHAPGCRRGRGRPVGRPVHRRCDHQPGPEPSAGKSAARGDLAGRGCHLRAAAGGSARRMAPRAGSRCGRPGPVRGGAVRQMLHGLTGEWVSRATAEAVMERTGGNPSCWSRNCRKLVWATRCRGSCRALRTTGSGPSRTRPANC